MYKMRLHAVAALAVALAGLSGITQAATPSAVERGRYLAAIAGCSHCHTPGNFFGRPDMTRFLGGSDVGFGIPDLGVFVGPNLTPDAETGLGRYTDAQMTTLFRTGTRPDGRILAPMMPWREYSTLTDADLKALIAYLRSLKPIKNAVPGPFGPQEKPTVFVMKVVPPEGAPAR
jgi:mono/diheme cytochrome c family protein